MDEELLSLRAALAQDRLEEFVQQAQARGTALDRGSEFERALALLMVQRSRRHLAPSALAALVLPKRAGGARRLIATR